MIARSQAETKDMLAIGDADGHLHVMQLPKNFVRSSEKETNGMREFLEREEIAVTYFEGRKQVLADLAEELQKQADVAMQNAGGEEDTSGVSAAQKEQELLQTKIDDRQSKYRSFQTQMLLQMEEEAAEKAAAAAKGGKSPKGK